MLLKHEFINKAKELCAENFNNSKIAKCDGKQLTTAELHCIWSNTIIDTITNKPIGFVMVLVHSFGSGICYEVEYDDVAKAFTIALCYTVHKETINI